MSRKRKRPSRTNGKPDKRPRIPGAAESSDKVDHPVLKHYFPKVLTLREHLIARLSTPRPALAQRLVDLGVNSAHDPMHVGSLLDAVIVGVDNKPSSLRQCRTQDLVAFSQQLPASTLGSNADPGASLQLEVSRFLLNPS